MKIQTVIFDWDGTLHDTKALYGAALRQTLSWLEEQGYSVPADQSDDRLARYLGVNARDMWNDFMPSLPAETKEECSRQTGEQMIREIRAGRARLYPGVTEVLRQLAESGYHPVILSNCKVPYMEAQRAHFRLDRWLEGFYCSGAYGFCPKEEIFPEIRKKFPEGFCMVGDRASDRQVSVVHHIPFVGCEYGFGTREELKGADALLSDIRELPAVLAQWNRE